MLKMLTFERSKSICQEKHKVNKYTKYILDTWVLYQFKDRRQNMKEICFNYMSAEETVSAPINLIDALTNFQIKLFEKVNKTEFHFSDKINKWINI